MVGWMIFWGVLFVALVVLELCTMQLISVWFAAGALAGFIGAACGMTPLGQSILFVAVSFVLLLISMPLLKKFRNANPNTKPVDPDVGKDAVVTEEISSEKSTGRIRIGDSNWRARTRSDAVIAVGTIVTVTEISGTTAYVTEKENY